MSDIFAEVDEAMRQERFKKFWDENAPYIVAFIVLTIGLTGGISFYKDWDKTQKQAQTSFYLETSEAEKFPENINPGTLKASDDISTLLKFRAADALIEKEQPDQAIALYQSIISNGAKRDFQDLARLALIRLDATQDKTALIEAINEDSPYFYPALIELAVHQYHAEQDPVAAVLTLKKVKAAEALSPALERQAADLLKLYQGKS